MPDVTFVPSVPGLATPPGYSYAASAPAERLIFVAGQVALDVEGRLVGGNDFGAQVTQSFANLARVLVAVGSDAAHVLKLTYYVVGLSPERLLAVREARDRMFTRTRPASTLVGVAALFMPAALFEVDAVVVKAG